MTPGWLTALASLSPVVAIAVLFVWGKRSDNKAKVKEEEARINLIGVLGDKFVEPVVKGLDANTEATRENAKAVHASVQHNEEIINNHLSSEAKRNDLLLEEMKAAVDAIKQSNNRRRATDQR